MKRTNKAPELRKLTSLKNKTPAITEIFDAVETVQKKGNKNATAKS